MEHDRSSEKNEDKKKKPILAITICALAAIVIVAVVVLLYDPGEAVAPPGDIDRVILSQYDKNTAIATLAYDPDLTFDNQGGLTIADAEKLKPIENDLFRNGKDGADILYTENIIGRVIQFGSDWVSARNDGDDKVFSSVAPNMNSDVEKKLKEKGGTAQIAFHRMDIGEIAHDGDDYYILTKETYTMAEDGALTPFEGVYAYRLTPKKDGLLIRDFEALSA
ncbi:MAG: hypothetical protein LBL63_03055 [Clostridiales Family XIII bacterium]|jgi:hypothetical protein|nr:hypothetical protein [Clostridiales Family XIII bacterium]